VIRTEVLNTILAAMQPADISWTRRATFPQIRSRITFGALDRLVGYSAYGRSLKQ
jgi:hypothetical protein